MYKYQEEKQKIFTEQGQEDFIKIRDRVIILLSTAGAFKMVKALGIAGSDTFFMQACIDRMVELGELREITNSKNVWGQDRVFVSTKN